MAPHPLKKSHATVSDDDGDDPLNMHDIQYDFEGSQIEDDEDNEVTIAEFSYHCAQEAQAEGQR